MSMALFGGRRIKAVIMGGSKGIGRAISEAIVTHGASIAVGARGIDALVTLKIQLSERAGTIHVAACDVSDPASVRRFMPAAADALGGIDILINCASSFSSSNDEEGWKAAFGTDLMGAVRCVNAALPYLKASSGGAIVNLSSVGVRRAAPDRIPYVAVKAALEQYTASAALAYAQSSIRVNCVVVGSTDFPGSMWDRIKRANPKLYETTKAKIPLGGFASPAKIADSVLFLASPLASWITGQCIVVDGGQTLLP